MYYFEAIADLLHIRGRLVHIDHWHRDHKHRSPEERYFEGCLTGLAISIAMMLIPSEVTIVIAVLHAFLIWPFFFMMSGYTGERRGMKHWNDRG